MGLTRAGRGRGQCVLISKSVHRAKFCGTSKLVLPMAAPDSKALAHRITHRSQNNYEHDNR